MTTVHQMGTSKKAFNLSLNVDLVEAFRAYSSSSLSSEVEALLIAELASRKEKLQAEAISLQRAAEGWSGFVQKHGSFADEFSTL